MRLIAVLPVLIFLINGTIGSYRDSFDHDYNDIGLEDVSNNQAINQDSETTNRYEREWKRREREMKRQWERDREMYRKRQQERERAREEEIERQRRAELEKPKRSQTSYTKPNYFSPKDDTDDINTDFGEREGEGEIQLDRKLENDRERDRIKRLVRERARQEEIERANEEERKRKLERGRIRTRGGILKGILKSPKRRLFPYPKYNKYPLQRRVDDITTDKAESERQWKRGRKKNRKRMIRKNKFLRGKVRDIERKGTRQEEVESGEEKEIIGVRDRKSRRKIQHLKRHQLPYLKSNNSPLQRRAHDITTDKGKRERQWKRGRKINRASVRKRKLGRKRTREEGIERKRGRKKETAKRRNRQKPRKRLHHLYPKRKISHHNKHRIADIIPDTPATTITGKRECGECGVKPKMIIMLF